MQLVCKEITEWIEEEVTRRVEEWVERTEEKCKKWPWPLNWVCKAVTTLVKVVTWVVEKVGKWVVRTVCTFVMSLRDLFLDGLRFGYELAAGLLTWNWERIVDAFRDAFTSLLGFLHTGFRVGTLGDTFDYINEEYQKGQLRDYVRQLLEGKYDGPELDAIKDALSVDHGAFGFRIRAKAVRTQLESHYKSNPMNADPDLLTLHETGKIDLRQLAGYEYESFGNRSRYESGASRSDIEMYISSRAKEGRGFVIRSMSDGVLKTKLDTASLVGRDVGLMLSWESEQFLRVSEPEDIILSGKNCCGTDDQVHFLRDVISRRDKTTDSSGAVRDLCTPVSVGVFRYEELTLNGLGTNLEPSTCKECIDCEPGLSGFEGHDVSGTTFKDRIPDFVYKYVPIHELGHYFGLCHPDVGVDRVMFTWKEDRDSFQWFSGRLVYSYLYSKGRPDFVLYEAKQTWDYIVANFSAECLRTRH